MFGIYAALEVIILTSPYNVILDRYRVSFHAPFTDYSFYIIYIFNDNIKWLSLNPQ